MGEIIKPVCLCPWVPSACTLTLSFLGRFWCHYTYRTLE